MFNQRFHRVIMSLKLVLIYVQELNNLFTPLIYVFQTTQSRLTISSLKIVTYRKRNVIQHEKIDISKLWMLIQRSSIITYHS